MEINYDYSYNKRCQTYYKQLVCEIWAESDQN